jgi:Protein of unknown function (DUF1565)
MTQHSFGLSFSFPRPVLHAAILMLGLGLAHARAATVVVATTGTDTPTCQPGPCRTVTQAIVAAHPGDTISIMAGPYSLPLETFPLSIDKNLTLTGAGAGITFIDAANANQRVIQIAPQTTVTITGVTIRMASPAPSAPAAVDPVAAAASATTAI